MKRQIIAALCLCMAGMAEDGVIAGKPFPEFSFTDLEGNSVSLTKAGEGKKLTVVYLFSASDDGCMNVFPEMEEVAAGIAAAAQRACDNKAVGYSQSDRDAILVDGTASAEPTNADCSSLVRQCIKEAAGVDPGDFTTADEASALEATGQFEPAKDYSAGVELYTGDVLVTKTKGHTVVVTEGKQRSVKFGWEKDGVVWRYYEVDGLPVKNDWRCIGTTSGKHWYWFNALGVMATGWQFIDGKWYYLDEDYGAWSEGACWRSDASGAQSVWTVE